MTEPIPADEQERDIETEPVGTEDQEEGTADGE
jgi:hypothetical protein